MKATKLIYKLKQQIEDMLKKLATMRTEPSTICPVNFSASFNSSNKPFNLDWIFPKITKETNSRKRSETYAQRYREIFKP